jgi:ubiquinone biosynthesis protein
LGRELDPDLDLWKTAKPYLERWMGEQVGPKGLLDNFKREAPAYASLIPALPRLLKQALEQQTKPVESHAALLMQLVAEQRRINRRLTFITLLVGVLALVALGMFAIDGYAFWLQLLQYYAEGHS